MGDNNGPEKQWSKAQIKQHQIAADLLCRIMDETFEFIRSNPEITEYEVQQYIVAKLKENDMVEDADPPIVAFRQNTSFVHYFPVEKTAKKLEQNSLIMIDIWARLNQPDAPFADITWMAWHGGEIPTEIQKGFDIIVKSRDSCVDYLKKNSKKDVLWNKDIAKSMEDIVLESGLQDFLPHSFGHSLGTSSVHGKHGIILQNSKSSLPENVGYTIEPGIYIENKYGFRSEIDFYVSQDKELVVTTAVQEKLVIV